MGVLLRAPWIDLYRLAEFTPTETAVVGKPAEEADDHDHHH